MDEAMIGSLIASTLRVSTPLILCALAGTLCERAGVIDLGDGGVCRTLGQRCTGGGECCSLLCFGGFCEPLIQ